MNRFNRYLVLYVILGVGLVLAWSQVGRRAQLSQVGEVVVMGTEDNCRALKTPCAAFAEHFALVAGPQADAQELLLVGEKLPPDATLETLQLNSQGREMAPPLVRAAGAQRWFVTVAPGAVRLRVNLISGERQWLAEYPLQ